MRYLHQSGTQGFLHLGDIGYTTTGQLLELSIVDIGPIQGHYIALDVVRGLEHEAVVCGCRCELDVRRNAFVGEYVRMDFDAAFLLSRLWMASNTFEKHVGEQGYSRGVYDLQPVYPT